jgi:IclR family transcriptional regulator, KDG regulon repressor
MTASMPKMYKVHSLERGLDLLEIMAQGKSEWALKELSLASGFNPTTTHRILDALKSRGYVRQNGPNSRYKLSLKLFELGSMVVRKVSLREEARPILEDLASKSGETAYFIILDEDEALCLERIDGFNFVNILYLQVGRRQPLHIGAGSRVLFAHLPEDEMDRIIKIKGLSAWTTKSITNAVLLKEDLRIIREQGYALSVDDVTEGAGALGCPVFDWKGKVVAAISISGLSSHFSKERLPPLIITVKEAASKLSRTLNAPSDNL